jgi:hypothetical protein
MQQFMKEAGSDESGPKLRAFILGFGINSGYFPALIFDLTIVYTYHQHTDQVFQVRSGIA